jgi:hypothetical protein
MPSMDFLNYPIGPCSPLARAKRELWLSDTVGQKDLYARESKYPFMDLEAGECFCIKLSGDELKDRKLLASLRSSASAYQKTYGRFFNILHHEAHGIYEVYRIA